MSTGPRTPEGKSVSRANSLKHGMTGRGIVLPDEDAEEIALRFQDFMEELRPRGGAGRFFAQRAAMLSVRLDRCVRNEAEAIATRMRGASEEFDRQRLAEVDHAYEFILAEPATQARKLRSMPEGIERIGRALLAIRNELAENGNARWDWTWGERVNNLMGVRWMEIPVTRVRALSEAISGNFEHLMPADGQGLHGIKRVEWARDRMIELLDAELDSLRDLRDSLDPATVDADRAGAPARALFDPSKEATLARRYEAIAESNLFRAIRQIKDLEKGPAPAASCPPPEPAMPPEPAAEPDEDPEDEPEDEPVGSSFIEAPETPRDNEPNAETESRTLPEARSLIGEC